MSSANQKQVAGKHYQSGFQHWDMLVKFGYGPEYYVGQATKYISRWRKKNGIPDLLKGQHFVEKLIELVKQYGDGFLPAVGVHVDLDDASVHLAKFFNANDITGDEAVIIDYLIFADSLDVLLGVDKLLNLLVAKETNKTVTEDYEFIEYTEHDTMRWRKKATGQELDLPLTMPPMQATWPV